jgi:hypothetical protein
MRPDEPADWWLTWLLAAIAIGLLGLLVYKAHEWHL